MTEREAVGDHWRDQRTNQRSHPRHPLHGQFQLKLHAFVVFDGGVGARAHYIKLSWNAFLTFAIL